MTRSPGAAPGVTQPVVWRVVSRVSSRVRSRVALLVVGAGLLGAGCEGEAARPRPELAPGVVPHLLLVTVDTWRGDHASSEVAGRPLTPRLDEFAATGVRYTDASSASDCTSPGMAGILTGLYPRRSGVVRNLHVLQKGVPNLAGSLRRAGFHTAAFVSNPVLAGQFGFGRGFDTYEFVPRELPRAKPRAATVVARALTWLDAQPHDARLFVWLHLMEPHGPYEPPEEVLARFPVEDLQAPRDLPLQPAGTTSGRGAVPSYQQIPGYVDPHDGREYLARYAAEVADLDTALGELLAAWDERGLTDQSLIVVTSDHGEALVDDHGFYFSHQNGLWQDQIHVPLVLSWPGCAAGSVVDAPVSTLDLAPTALGLLGVSVSRPLDGHDLRQGPPTRVVAESRDELALRAGRWKLTRRDGLEWLVDLSADPGETEDAAARAPDVAARLQAELAELDALVPLVTPVERDTQGKPGGDG